MLTPKDVKKIAQLARLSLSDAETDKMTSELKGILQFVEKLGEMDLKNVEATSHAVEVTNVFREDKAVSSSIRDKALDEAPEREQNFFKVPRVI